MFLTFLNLKIKNKHQWWRFMVLVNNKGGVQCTHSLFLLSQTLTDKDTDKDANMFLFFCLAVPQRDRRCHSVINIVLFILEQNTLSVKSNFFSNLKANKK